jgi:hypothetical protein
MVGRGVALPIPSIPILLGKFLRISHMSGTNRRKSWKSF